MPTELSTPLTKRLGIRHPVLLAGMATVSNAGLCAAVTNAGGLGTIGGVTLTPNALRREIADIKAQLVDKSAPFGVDLLLPKVGGGARKTNKDYTKGHLDELVDIIIQERAAVFISAVGLPPPAVVDKLHAAGILVANMVGSPKHVDAAIDVGVDIVIAQGYEAGGHTGDIGTLVLVRQCVERARARTSKLGKPIHVVAAGGIADGRGMAAAFALGAEAAWVGTRFICAEESGAPETWRNLVMKAQAADTFRTQAVTGRPLRLYRTPYYAQWEKRSAEIQALCDRGIIPVAHDFAEAQKAGKPLSPVETRPYFMGQCAGSVRAVMPAKDIVESMVAEAVQAVRESQSYVVVVSGSGPAGKL